MSLRLRLTLLYTTLAGGVLLIFGTLVYGMVSLVLWIGGFQPGKRGDQ
jgi:hypothetical protein